MSQFEVIVRSVTETSYMVEARDIVDAKARWHDGVEGTSIVEQEDVVHVTNLDDVIQWDDDEEPLQPEEYEADDYEESSV